MERSHRLTRLPARRHRLTAVAVLAAASLLAAGPATPAAATVAASTAKARQATAPAGEVLGVDQPTRVRDSFVVVLRDSAVGGRAGTRHRAVSTLATEVTGRYGIRPDRVWGDALNGFSVRTSEAVARRIAAHPAVAYVEADQTVRAANQANAPWNLDRLDAPGALDTWYKFQSRGTRVRAYVVDSGIRIAHQEFGGRAQYGYDAVDGTLPADDCYGHGTHVAGTVGGRTYGVAKDVALIAVRVLDCSGVGTVSSVLSGINWVIATNGPSGAPAVANVGLTSSLNLSLNTAVANLFADGVVVTVPAGNSNVNACNVSPAAVPQVLTVGATQSNDSRANFSNWGTCLDLFAPGVNVPSATHTSNTATALLSGTSHASPAAAGIAARVRGANPTWTPAQVQAYLTSVAVPVVTNQGTGSPNLLLHMSPLL